MKKRTYIQRTRWWFTNLLTGWKELSDWWAGCGYAWKDAVCSLAELVVIVLSPLLAITAPLWALIEHINERRIKGEGK